MEAVREVEYRRDPLHHPMVPSFVRYQEVMKFRYDEAYRWPAVWLNNLTLLLRVFADTGFKPGDVALPIDVILLLLATT